MAPILLFGATGYTGSLTARALQQRGADFALAGRNAAKLEKLADETNASQVHVVEVGDVEGLVRALDGGRVLVTCVGPFMHLGDTAVEAALRAGTHYIDSTGEGPFVRGLIAKDPRAREAGIAMAPAMGFDEVPADVTASLATAGLDHPELVLTYAFPSHGSRGTIRTSLDIAISEGQWVRDGKPVPILAGHETRWAPMPSPLGPRRSVAFPFAEGYLAPLHLELSAMKLFLTSQRAQEAAMRFGRPLLRVLMQTPARAAVEMVLKRLPDGPQEDQRSGDKWTILGEARAGSEWRNVALMGTDPYGMTAELLASAAVTMSRDDYDKIGVLSPVQAMGLAPLQDELRKLGVTTKVFEVSDAAELAATRH